MWARHRPDVSLGDLGFALRTLLGAEKAADSDKTIMHGWFPAEEAVVCLSVRSGFDLLLQSLPLNPDDEILFTEVTIGGMVRVAQAAGGVVRGVPVDRSTLTPRPSEVVNRITARTRAIVLAPLFGSRYPIASIAEVARRRGVMVIEDAAQAFAGKSFSGSPEADVTMFSFGMIKRATAAGGAVLRVRDRTLREAMRTQLATHPRQSRWDYARRLAMLALLRAASHHRLYGCVYRLLGLFGDPDKLVSSMGKTRRSQQSINRLRRRPCAAMQRMIARRVQQNEALPSMVPQRALAILTNAVCGSSAPLAPTWVLPVTVKEPEQTLKKLRRLGYDPSSLSSLISVPTGAAAEQHWLKKTVFLPTDDKMPPGAQERMLRATIE